MAHVNVIDVNTCELVWIINANDHMYDYNGNPVNYGAIDQKKFFTTNDAHLRWGLRLTCQVSRLRPHLRGMRSYNWYVTLIAENQNVSENHRSDDGEERGYDTFQTVTPNGYSSGQRAIIGEATFQFKIELTSSPINCSEETKKYIISTSATMLNENDEICRYKFAEGLQWVVATVTCKVSYTHVINVIPLLIPGQNVTVPVENSALIPVTDSLKNLYMSKKYSDVTVCVNGTDYYAHKIVLSAHSKVFDAMFEHDMEEKKLNIVQIKDVDDLAFLQALRFMYTGKVEDADELVYETILPVADRYDIKGLKLLCENKLRKQMSPETVLQILMLADSYNVDGLKTSAIEFLTIHSKDVAQVMSSEDWDKIMARPRLMKDLLGVFMIGNK